MPVLFGPKYRSFAEAVELVERGAAVSVAGAAELEAAVAAWVDDPAVLAEKGRRAAEYVRSRAGATAKILETIEPSAVGQ